MDIQDIHDFIRKQREQGFSTSNQLSLGELISEIEKIGIQKGNGEIKDVSFDFGSAVPTILDSWRGSYNELALGYELSGYDNNEKHFSDCKADKFLEHLKSVIGKEFYGWKGGEYVMDENTPVWVANSGNSGNTAIVGVLDDGWRLVIITSYCEY